LKKNYRSGFGVHSRASFCASIADAIAYARVTYLGLPLSILSEPDASSQAQITYDDWLGS
jgi:hypothetical protein